MRISHYYFVGKFSFKSLPYLGKRDFKKALTELVVDFKNRFFDFPLKIHFFVKKSDFFLDEWFKLTTYPRALTSFFLD